MLCSFEWNMTIGSTSKNIHVQEERGQITSSESIDWDEEDRFSGVGIIGKVDGKKLEPAQSRNSIPEGRTCAAADSTDSAPANFTTPESDQKDGTLEKKKREHKLNADAAEWKPPSQFSQSSVSESSKLPNQSQTVVSEYPSFSSMSMYSGLQQSHYMMQMPLMMDQQYPLMHNQPFYQPVVHTGITPHGPLYVSAQNGYVYPAYIQPDNNNVRPENISSKVGTGRGKSISNRK
jgi:hypothetical protein